MAAKSGFAIIRSIKNCMRGKNRFISDDPSSVSIIYNLTSKKPCLRSSGLRSLICMLQRRADCSMFDKVVVEVDTGMNIDLSRMVNRYMIWRYAKKDIKLVMGAPHVYDCNVSDAKERSCDLAVKRESTAIIVYKESTDPDSAGLPLGMYMQTLQKFIESKDEGRQMIAIEFVTELSDDVACARFVERLKYIVRVGSVLARAKVAMLISMMAQRDREVISRWGMIDEFNLLARDDSMFVSSVLFKGIGSFNGLEMGVNTTDLVRFVGKVVKNKDDRNFHSGLSICISSIIQYLKKFSAKELEELVKELLPLMNFDVIAAIIVYGAVVRMDPKIYQSVFHKLALYLYHTDEILFHLLDAIYKMIKEYSHITYDNKLFVSFSTEPDYVKLMRMKILHLKLDEVAMGEIRRIGTNPHLSMAVMNFLLEKDIPIEDVFKVCASQNPDKLVESVYRYRPRGDVWKSLINKYLRIDSVNTWTGCIVAMHFDEVPDVLRCPHEASIGHLLAYIGLFLRRIITKSQLMEYLTIICSYNKDIINETDRVVGMLRGYSVDLFGVTYEYLNSNVSEYLGNALTNSRENIGERKPFPIKEPENGNDTGEALKGKAVASSPATQDAFSECEKIRRNYSTQNSLFKRDGTGKTEKKRIDIKCISNVSFSGRLCIRDKLVVLHVEALTRPFKVKVMGLSPVADEVVINEEGEHIVGKMNGLSPFSVSVNDRYNYSVNVGLNLLIEPYDCDDVTFEEQFNRIPGYVIISKGELNPYEVGKLDNNSLSFKVLDEPFFGRDIGGRTILKCGDDSLLKEFLGALRRNF